MKTSIALCTYNGERHLPAQLASLCAQTRLPDEVVISDDGSTDGTMALLEAFSKTAPFPVHSLQNRSTLGSTRNFEQVLRRCQGDAIALCDQDDVWAPEKLASMVRILEEDAAVGGVFSNAALIGDDGGALPGDLWQRQEFTPARQARFHHSSAGGQLLRRDTVTGATLIFRASWLPVLLPIPPDWIHDGWIALLLASLAELRALPSCLMSYRLHHAQQVGAVQVALQTHLSTPAAKAQLFHRANLHRWQGLLTRMEQLQREGQSFTHQGWAAQPDAGLVADLRRKVGFVRGRATLLRRSRARRIFPAAALLAGYLRYDKGILSLLRDLTHRLPEDAA